MVYTDVSENSSWDLVIYNINGIEMKRYNVTNKFKVVMRSFIKTSIVFFLFSCWLFAGCKKDDETPPTLTIDDVEQVYINDGNSSVRLISGQNQYSNIFSDKQVSGHDSVADVYYYSGFGNVNIPLVPQFQMSIGSIRYSAPYQDTSKVPNSVFDSLFYIGNRDYVPVRGVRISYSDADGNFNSYGGMGADDQTGSSFNITDRKAYDIGNGHYIKIRAEFHCKVYDGFTPATGDHVKTISGTTILSFLNY